MSATHDSTTAGSNGLAVPAHRHLWIVTGPAGCGKTTVAEYLAKYFSLPYLEGDSVCSMRLPDLADKALTGKQFHPKANVEKMAHGIPLTDADRWDWLILLRQQSLASLEAGATGVVLTCSALKRKYRDVIRIAAYNDPQVKVHFIFLSASSELLFQRVHARVGHYMKDDMVRSQLETLELPQQDETDVLTVDVSGDFASVHKLALGVVNTVMAKDAGQ